MGEIKFGGFECKSEAIVRLNSVRSSLMRKGQTTMAVTIERPVSIKSHRTLNINQSDSITTARMRREAELLASIHATKPDNFRSRYDILSAKADVHTLTPDEDRELLKMIDELGEFDVQYVVALSELACLRNIKLPDLMNQLRLKAETVV